MDFTIMEIMKLSIKEDFHGEHSTEYLTSRSYSIQYVIIYTMLLLRSLKDNYKKITLHSIVVLMV